MTKLLILIFSTFLFAIPALSKTADTCRVEIQTSNSVLSHELRSELHELIVGRGRYATKQAVAAKLIQKEECVNLILSDRTKTPHWLGAAIVENLLFLPGAYFSEVDLDRMVVFLLLRH